MRTHVQTRLFVWGSVLLVLAAIAAVPLSSAFRHRKQAATLDDPNPAVRVAAIRAMDREGDADLLIKALQDEDLDVRLVAVMHLKRGSQKDAARTRALLTALKDNKSVVRREATEALSESFGADVPTLMGALSDPDPRVRAGAALGLWHVGNPDESRATTPEEKARVIAALEKLLEDDDAEVRRSAADSLDWIRHPNRHRK